MNADVEKAVETIARKAFAFDAMVAAGRISQELAGESLALADGPIELTDAATIRQALRDQEAEIAGLRAMIGVPVGVLPSDAPRAITRAEEWFRKFLDEQARAEKAEALLRELLGSKWETAEYRDVVRRITAHLGGEHE